MSREIEILREALLGCAVMKSNQFGKPCWRITIARLYCVGQEQCTKAQEALKETEEQQP